MSNVRYVVVRGRVQGVGYRAWVEAAVLRHDLEGWVRNRRDGTVEAVFSGPEDVVLAIVAACRRGPRSAQVEAVDVEEGEPDLLAQRRPGERFSVLPTV
jgi:acylphosphatase